MDMNYVESKDDNDMSRKSIGLAHGRLRKSNCSQIEFVWLKKLIE